MHYLPPPYQPCLFLLVLCYQRLTALQHLLVLLTRNIFPSCWNKEFRPRFFRVMKFFLFFFLLSVNNFRFRSTCAPTGCCNLDQISLTGCIRVVIYTFSFLLYQSFFFSCTADKALTVSCLFFFSSFSNSVSYLLSKTDSLECGLVLRSFAYVLLWCSCSVLSCPSNPGLSMRWGTEEGIKAVAAATAGAPTPAVHGKTNKDTCW